MAPNGYVLLYDEDCGLCAATSRLIRALDLRGHVRLRPIRASRDLLAGVPEDRHLDAFHVVSPGGFVATGGDAVPPLLDALPLGAGAARILRESDVLMPVVRSAYGFVARFRDALTCRVRAPPSAQDEARRSGREAA